MIVGLGLYTYYSIQHVQAAAHLSARAARLERRIQLISKLPMASVAYKGNVISSIFTTVSFLEALANELFADAANDDGGHLTQLSPTQRASIAANLRSDRFERKPVMAKFHILLQSAGCPPINRGDTLHQHVDAAIQLRNALVHYKAEFFDVGTEGMVRNGSFMGGDLASRIKGKFPHRPGSSPMEADSWISAGCSRWALRSSLAFTDELFSRLSVTPLYAHVRNNIDPGV
ncbi:hypothetical protein ACFJGW_07540 [Burkholderiaceae bacterium UC74_6]